MSAGPRTEAPDTQIQPRELAFDPLHANFFQRARHFLQTHVRYEVILLLFVTMTINQADRAAQSVSASPMSHSLHLSQSEIGWLFSAFAWSYTIFQVPSGWALDRYGSRRVFGFAVIFCSIFIGLISMSPWLDGMTVPAIFVLIFLFGLASAPTFPANSKIVAAWFPTNERGTASSIFNATQYFAAAVFTPLLAWVGVSFGWRAIYLFMGVLGVAAGLVFFARFQFPNRTKRLSKDEYDVLREGGALFDLRRRQPATQPPGAAAAGKPAGSEWQKVRRLLSSRAMLGIYLGQYCISVVTFFFLTWFPIYLVQQRHVSLLHAGMMASLPAICGFVGGLFGGVFSDTLMRRTKNLSIARKTPIYIGMTLCMSLIVCNYLSSDVMILCFMALSYFGKAMGALGWAVVSDTSPLNAVGLNASIFNTFSSLAGITTPIAIGYLVQNMHSFNGALIFVGLHAAVAIFSYAVIIGPIRRMDPV